MKELQKTVESYITNRHKQKKYLAVLTALSIMISFVVPFTLIEPAISTTGDGINPQAANATDETLQNYSGKAGNIVDGVTYSPSEMSVKDLLIGHVSDNETHSWADGCTTAAEVVESAKRQYFLGIAYDFCVFLESNFEPTDSDAEGRVAVGGNIIKPKDGNYQIGAGDFGSNTALKDTDNYQGITDFAHAIANGYIGRVDPYGTKNGGGKAANYDSDFFKRLVISDYDQSYHRDDNDKIEVYSGTHNHYLLKNGSNDWIGSNPITDADEAAQIYMQTDTPLIDFTETFEWLRNQSEALSAKTSIPGVIDGSTITFTIPKNIKAGDTVYFSLESWPENVTDIYFEFEDKENPPVVRDGLPLVEENNYNEPEGSWCPTCNIVINCGGNSFGTGNSANLTNTYINGLPISNRPKGIGVGDYYDKVRATNNRLASEKILYNFYEAGKTDDSVKSTLKGNFNGTIFAPYANVESAEGCDGHLSGALIAKSFHGGMEFGYRPYRGTIDILGSKAGYAVPFDKFITGTDNPLAGATFAVTDENGKNVLSWTSDGSTKYAEIPAEVDFTGETDYSAEDAVLEITHAYTVSEKNAPTGYIKSDRTYKVIVNEKVDKDYLLEMTNENGALLHIPQKVDVTLTITPVDENGTEGESETFKFQIRDAYDLNGYLSQRKVVMMDENGEVTEVYGLNLDENQNITQLGKIDVGFADETESQQPTEPEETQPETVPTEEVSTESEEIQPEAETTDAAAQVDDPVNEGEQPTTEAAEPTTEVVSEDAGDDNSAENSYKIINAVDLAETIYGSEDLQQSKVIAGTNYYYDKNSIMVMPLPQTTPSFENKPGLLFTKVDNSGKPLTGAAIKLYAGESEITDENIWKWDSTASSYLIDIDNDNLNPETVYRFEETEPPMGYETADSIYFKKGSDGKLYYGSAEDSITTEIIKNESGYYSIEMTDIKISGAKIRLQKYKADMNTRLGGSKFQLLSKNNELIYPMAESESFEIPLNEDFDLFATLRNAAADTYNTNYVQNGYLKPGTYILHETVAPNGGYLAQDFKFKVKVGTDGSYEIEPLKSGSSSMADPEDMYLETSGDGNALLIIKGTLLEMAKNNPDEIFIDNLGTVDQIHVSSDGNDWGGNLNISMKNSYTYNEILNSSGKSSDEIQYIRFMRWSDGKRPFDDVISQYYDGSPSGSGSGGSDNTPGYAEITIRKADSECAFGNWWDKYNFSENTVHEKTGNSTNVQDIILQNANNSFKNTKFNITFTYSDGTSQTKTDVGVSDGSRLDISGLTNQNVTGVKIEAIVATAPEPTTEAPTAPPSSEDEPELLDLEIADDGTIKIPNQKLGMKKITITAQKVWEDDTGFESLRPKEITVTLKRKLPDGTVDSAFGQPIKLNDANKWKAAIPGLDILVDENGTNDASNQYKYYVEENSVPENYEVRYSENNTSGLSASGTIEVINKLNTKNISVTKQWLNSEGKAIKPDGTPNVTVKLQWREKGSTDEYTDVSGKTLVLQAPDYTGTFEKLPANKDYQIVEVNVPQGWKFDKTIENADDGFTIINKPDVGGLTVEKKWDDNFASSLRPEEIRLKLFRTIVRKTTVDAPNFDPNIINDLVPDYSEAKYTSQGITQTNDYARLLQYSLYFYDANMCGSQVGENSAYDWRDDCHVGNGLTVDGGFHDAGDHTMFGLPQGFSASTLGWSYYENKESYDSLGLTDHYQMIMKHFCDFFANSIKSENGTTKILVQKGQPGTDQNYWDKPEGKSCSDYGGEKWVSSGAANIAAQYAAALAQYSLNFPNDPNSAIYLQRAKEFYTYAVNNKNGNNYNYNAASDSECTSELAWASAWLYLATEESNYKTDCAGYLNGLAVHKLCYYYGDVAAGAMAVYGAYIDDNYNISTLKNYLDSKCSGDSFVQLDGWGSARHNTLLQTVALSASKNFENMDYTDWCKNQMAYILGANNIASNGKSSTCFVTGYADNSPINLHHRAATGTKLAVPGDWGVWNSWDGYYSSLAALGGTPHKIVGALAGGPSGNNYNDNCKDHTGNEVALDYNAGLVAAAAGLYDVYGTGITYSNVSKKAKMAEPDAQSFDFDENALNGVTLNYDAPAVLANEAEYPLAANLDDVFEVNLKKVTSIKFNVTRENVAGGNINGTLYINPPNSNGSFSMWDAHLVGCSLGYTTDLSFERVVTLDSPTDVTKIKFFYNNSGSNLVDINVTFYYEPEGIQITSDKDITITEGDTAVITANQSATWSIEPTDGKVTIESNGNTCTVKANGYTDGTYTVKATGADNSEATATVRVAAKGITISQNGNPITEPIKLRPGGTAAISVDPTDNITFSAGSGVTVTGSNGQYTITAGDTAVEDAAITFTRNGKSAAVHVTVLGNLTINGSDAMNKKDTQQLTAENVVGTLTWEVIVGGDLIEISPEGIVTSKDKDGKAKVKVTDSDGSTAEFEIEVKLTGIIPTIPENEVVDEDFEEIIILNLGNNWQKEITNLEKNDANGNEYHYYIVEVGADNEPINVVHGNNVTYYPTKYEGNGSVITGDDTILSVTNTLSGDKPVTMPSTGGEGVRNYYVVGLAFLFVPVTGYLIINRRKFKLRKG